MNLQGRTLLIPKKTDIERDRVADTWRAMNWDVVRLDRFWEPPAFINSSDVTLYGNDTFCLVLEQKLDLNLISPPDDLIKTMDQKLMK